MILVNDEKLALVNVKPKKGLRYKTVSVNGWWLIKTEEKNEGVIYNQGELQIIKDFVIVLWKRGYRKTMEQLVRSTRDKNLLECFYKSTSLTDFIKVKPGNEKTDYLPKSLYQKRSYSVYSLAHDLVGKEVCVDEELVGKYKKITEWVTTEPSQGEWHKVTSLMYNQKRANISLVLDGGSSARCIIKDGTLNMPSIGVRDFGKKLPRGVKMMDLIMEGEQLLDLTKLPVSSRSDFSRRLASNRLVRVVAELEYAKMAKRQFCEKKAGKVEQEKRGYKKVSSTYQASCLEIKTKYKQKKLLSDQGKNWNEEYEKLRQEKSKLVFEIFSKKLWTWQEPKATCVEGTQKSLRVGPEKILINVKIEHILNKDIKV